MWCLGHFDRVDEGARLPTPRGVFSRRNRKSLKSVTSVLVIGSAVRYSFPQWAMRQPSLARVSHARFA